MKRRRFLSAVAICSTGASDQVPSSRLALARGSDVLREVARDYFDALPDTKAKRNEVVVACADNLCSARKTVPEGTLDSVVEDGRSGDRTLRRIRFGVRLLNEYDLTTVIDEDTVADHGRQVREGTRYLPLVGSFNNLCRTACEVDPSDSETVADFLYAALAFGIEVALWSVGAPYTMAFRGTRFVATRSFLRFARYGCQGCVALAMSELHWAIRHSVYGDVVTENNVAFVSARLRELGREADRIGYDVDVEHSEGEIADIIAAEAEDSETVASESHKRENWWERLLPEIEIPGLSDLIGEVGVFRP